jgi:hypothetical protein
MIKEDTLITVALLLVCFFGMPIITKGQTAAEESIGSPLIICHKN